MSPLEGRHRPFLSPFLLCLTFPFLCRTGWASGYAPRTRHIIRYEILALSLPPLIANGACAEKKLKEEKEGQHSHGSKRK